MSNKQARLTHSQRSPAANTRGSETVRRASRMLSWALVGLVLFGINTVAAEYLHHSGIVTYVFTRTLLLSLIHI